MALQEILKRFYADFPPHPEEKKYNYVVSSSMKPTQVLFKKLFVIGFACICEYVCLRSSIPSHPSIHTST